MIWVFNSMGSLSCERWRITIVMWLQAYIMPCALLNTYSYVINHTQGNLRGESGLFFTPVLTLWSSRHITRHIWRWVIVPSDLAQSFGATCPHNRYCVIHRMITNMRVWFSPNRKGSFLLLGGLGYKKIRRYNNSTPYMTARWLPQQIPP